MARAAVPTLKAFSARPLAAYAPQIRRTLQCAVLAGMAGAGSITLAGSFTWDATASSPTQPVDGAGTWDTSTTNWSNGASDVAWTNGSNVAIFGSNSGAAGTVTLASAMTVSGITFNASSSGTYTLTGGSLRAPSGNLNIIANVNAVIDTAFVGTFTEWGNLNVTTGAGVLTLTGTSSFGPNLQIYAGGTLAVSSMASPGPLGSPAGGVRFRGGTLRYTGAQASANRTLRFYETGGTIEIGTGATGVLTLSGITPTHGGTAAATRGITLSGSNASASGTISNAMSDTTSTFTVTTAVYKTGTGVWSLTGASTYTGGTTVSAGTLKTGSTGALGKGDVTVINMGSVVELGNSNSIADTATLSLASGATLKMSFNSATESVAVLSLGGTVFNTPTLFSAANDFQGFASYFTGSSSTASLQVVPEPAGISLAAGLSSLLLNRRTRRRVRT